MLLSEDEVLENRLIDLSSALSVGTVRGSGIKVGSTTSVILGDSGPGRYFSVFEYETARNPGDGGRVAGRDLLIMGRPALSSNGLRDCFGGVIGEGEIAGDV